MLELHGVLFSHTSQRLLKQRALLFDKFLVVDWGLTDTRGGGSPSPAEWDFLQTQGVVEFAPRSLDIMMIEEVRQMGVGGLNTDHFIRSLAAYYTQFATIDVVGICEHPLPPELPAAAARKQHSSVETTLGVAVEALPAPDETCSWEDVINFKAHLRDKQWGFRRFLRTLSTKPQTAAEIRDEIEWMVNEYRKAMEIYHIKASQSFVDVFVVSPLEIIENLVKLNLSRIAKGALSVTRRRAEMLEAEMKAPGRECAYVFDARKRFCQSED